MTSISRTDADISSQLGMAGARYAKEQDDLPEHTVVRERFSNRLEALFTILGYTVGPGNVWRFPYLVLQNGGAVFVLIYVITVVLIGIPMLFMEFTLGQFSGKDQVKVWDLNPAFRGVGFSMTLGTLLMTFNFHIFMAHCLLYASDSFRHTFPWAKCKPEWKHCFDDYPDLKNITRCNNLALEGNTCLCDRPKFAPVGCIDRAQVAADFYYRYSVLGEGSGEDAKPSWMVVLFLLLSWTLTAICTYRGIRTSGKVIYVTVLAPFLALIILLLKAIIQTGAEKGAEFLFTNFQWDRLTTIRPWMDAVGHTSLSLSTSLGLCYVLGSYHSFENKSRTDVLVAAVVDTATSLVASAVVFMTIGHACYLAGQHFNIEDIVASDLSLAFVAYPAALSTFPIPHVWSTTFFVMMYLLAIDSMFGLIESTMTYLQYDFRAVRRRTVRCRILFVFFCFLVDVLLTSANGYHVVMTIDTYINVCFPVIGFVEVVAIMWGYGFRRCVEDLEYMLGIKVPLVMFFFVIYAILIPAGLFAMFLATMVKMDQVQSPYLWHSLGIVVTVLVLLPIPLWLILHIWAVCRRKRTKRLTFVKWLKRLVRPSKRWAPNDGTNTQRDVDTVFADIFPRLRTRRVRRRLSQQKNFELCVGDFEKQVESFYAGSETRSHMGSLTGLAGMASGVGKKTSFLPSPGNLGSGGDQELYDLQEGRRAVEKRVQMVQRSQAA